MDLPAVIADYLDLSVRCRRNSEYREPAAERRSARLKKVYAHPFWRLPARNDLSHGGSVHPVAYPWVSTNFGTH